VSLSNLGCAHLHLQEHTAAKARFEQALAIRRQSLPPGHPNIADSLDNLGSAQGNLREYAAAKASHQEALIIRRQTLPPGHPDIADSLYNLGNAQIDRREYAAARASHEEALAIRRKALPAGHPKIASSVFNLALTALASGIDVRDAVSRFVEATEISQADQLRLAVVQAEPEQLVTAAGSKKCVRFLIGATLTARADPGPVYDRLVGIKGSVTAQQRWVRETRNAADPETARVLDRLRQVTAQFVSLSLSNGGFDKSSDPRDVSILLRTLSEDRTRLEQQLMKRSAVYRTIQSRARVGGQEIRAALPRGTALIDLVDYLHVEVPSGDERRTFGKQRLAAFVIRPDQQEVSVIPLGPTQVLAELIDRWRASYGAGKAPPAGAPDPAKELRKRLWEPLAKHLDGIKVVLVSPDGPLNGLPLAALPGSNPGAFLIEEYAFAVVPVPQLLPEMLRGRPHPAGVQPSLLLAGAIDFGTGRAPDAGSMRGTLPPVPIFPPLAGAAREVNELRAEFTHAFPAAPAARLLEKDKATKPAIMTAASAYRFIHLATHGFFAGELERSAEVVAERSDMLSSGLRFRPEAAGRHPGLLSGLVFAGVNRLDRRPDEAILTALEAAELELADVELVVLSACDTGRGQVAGGEGALGLQRAFQLAGAHAVAASLWKVPDEATQKLMAEFYKNLWEKKLSRLEALRQAQLTMLSDFAPQRTPRRGGIKAEGPERVEDLPELPPAGGSQRLPPYYWAAFVLSGDWR